MAEEQSVASDDAAAISTFSLIAAVIWIFSIAALSIWAEVETSSSTSAFSVTVVNDAKFTSAGHRFHLAYVSTDEATRILLNASDFAHHFLYLDDHPALPDRRVRHVTLGVAAARSDRTAVDGADGRFRVTLSASVIENSDLDYALKSALLSAMARVWLYAGHSTAPPWLIDGMAEYVTVSAGFGTGKQCNEVDGMAKLPADSPGRWRNDHRACAVAQYLRYCQVRNNGYIRRLNQSLRDPSVDPTVGDNCSIGHIMKVNQRVADMEPIASF